MGNESHLEELKKGIDDWNKWRRQNPKISPDLSNTNFTVKDNAGNCWDDNCNCVNFNLADFNNCSFENSNLTNAIFRNSTNLEKVDFFNSTLKNADFSGTNLKKAKFDLSDATGSVLRGAYLEEATFDGADFSSANFANAHLEGVKLTANIVNADLSGCDAYFIPWTSTILGYPKIPENYPTKTSALLINGLSPHTQKMLADGVHLRTLWDSSNSWNKIGLRIWGITCGYGQRIMRWIVCSILFILLFSAIATQIEMNISTHHKKNVAGSNEVAVEGQVSKPSCEQAIYLTVITFATLGYGDITPITPIGRVWSVIVVCVGYLMFGGFISIFSTKLSRLT